jgi:TonB-dependent starch-binding outer membrane protein SusC
MRKPNQMLKPWLFAILLLAGMAASILSSAQQQSIRGTVTDNQGMPLPGVTIVVKGTTIGTVTDSDGSFRMQIPEDAETIVFSFVGMGTQEIPVEGKTNFEITMTEETIGLEEVVAIGYGTVKKSDLTGSVSSVKPDEILKAPIARIDQALQGRAAGVYVTSFNNAPGGGTTIRIRGGNSITAGNEPLYVIDGIIGAALNNLSPNDIESIEVLKDASSTAIYGTRGANGVI